METDGVVEFVFAGRDVEFLKTLQFEIWRNTKNLLNLSLLFFEKKIHNVSTLLSMISIEESGKIFTLNRITSKPGSISSVDLRKVNINSLDKFLRDHKSKALDSAARVLLFNREAKKRSAEYNLPKNIFSSFFLISLSSTWMDIRNNCQYVDYILKDKKLIIPSEIDINYSFYFVYLCFESIIRNLQYIYKNQMKNGIFEYHKEKNELLLRQKNFVRRNMKKFDFLKIEELSEASKMNYKKHKIFINEENRGAVGDANRQ